MAVGTLRQFTVDMTRWEALTQEELKLLTQGFATTLFNEVSSGGKHSPGTPIDTGFHRAMWQGGVGAAPAAALALTQEEARANPGAARAAIAASDAQVLGAIQEFGPGKVLHLSNKGPAIRRLEFGWSMQARHGFIRLALAAAQQILDEVGAFLVSRRKAA